MIQTFRVRAQPNSKTESIERNGDQLRIKLHTPPHEGRANTQLIKMLARHFKVSKSQVEIVSGLTSKNKVVRIYTLEKIKNKK